MYRVKDGCSFVDFKGNTPKRCLDLGTGVRSTVYRTLRIQAYTSILARGLVHRRSHGLARLHVRELVPSLTQTAQAHLAVRLATM